MSYLLNIFQDLNEKDVAIMILLITLLIIIVILLTYIKLLKNKQKSPNEIPVKTDIIEATDNAYVTQELTELESEAKELEQLAKGHEVKMTPYEEEQEEKAIISYDELLEKSSNVSIGYSSFSNEDDIVVKQVDLSNTGKIELDPIQKELNSKVRIINYEHEEEFLNALKQLKNMLN